MRSLAFARFLCRLAVGLVGTLGSFSRPAQAAYIRIQTVVEPIQITGQSGTANIQIKNTGDEAARMIVISAILPEGFSLQENSFPELAPNQEFKVSAKVLCKTSENGTYAGALLVQYTDTNGYPFSLTSPLPFYLGRGTSPSIALQGEKASLHQHSRTTLRYEVFSREPQSQVMRAWLATPKELAATKAVQILSAAPQLRMPVRFDISENGALAGSTYVPVLIVDYSKDGAHYASTFSAPVTILPERSPYLAAMMAVAVALLLVLVAYARRSRSAR